MSGEVSQMSSSSSGSEEPDDEFMLRLYTGKLTSTEQYEVIQEENETNEVCDAFAVFLTQPG